MSETLRKLLADIEVLGPMLELKKEIADRFKPLYMNLIEQAAVEAERHVLVHVTMTVADP